MLNAIVHIDSAFIGSTFINLFSDRLELISLGGLVSGVSLEAAMLGASQPRNEKLANLFYRMKLIEAYGTGISKIVSGYKGLSVQPNFKIFNAHSELYYLISMHKRKILKKKSIYQY